MVRSARPIALLAVAVIILALAVVGLGLLLGCSSPAPATETVKLQLNWFHEAEFVGYYVAVDKGFYDEENLDVTLVEGGPGIQARDEVLNGGADFAISSFGEQRTLVETGEPVVALASAFQIPPLVIFSLADSGIREPRDLAGRRVGVKNDYWRDVLHETLENAGVDPAQVIEVEVDADAKRLLYEGAVDVWMGYAHDEPIEAQVAGYQVTTIFPADYGVGGYEGLLLANETTVADRAAMVQRFVRASHRGWLYVVEHPDEAAEVMTRWQPKDGLEFQKLAVRALMPLVDIPQAPIGWIDEPKWRQLIGDSFDAEHPGYTMRFFEDVE